MKSFLSLWKKIEPDDLETVDVPATLVLKEKELLNYLILIIFISKITESKYFIYIKQSLPLWDEIVTNNIDFSGELSKYKDDSILENYTKRFAEDVEILIRLARIRFHHKPRFMLRVDKACNNALV